MSPSFDPPHTDYVATDMAITAAADEKGSDLMPLGYPTGGPWDGGDESHDYTIEPIAADPLHRMLAACREQPDGSRVRWKFEDGERWLITSGREFLGFWDQSGRAILIDYVSVLPTRREAS